MKYYSQNGEDYILSEFFDRKREGFYIDVGAFDGIHLSNSYTFEQLGWDGICVEPHPDYFPLCFQNRKKALCLQVACVENDERDFIEFYAEEIGLLSGININNNIEEIKKRYEKRNLKYIGVQKIEIKAMTLNSIIEKYYKNDIVIDFISIDVEGSEIDVLKGFNFSKYCPRIILIESNSEEQRKEIESYICQNSDYILARSERVNNFFVRTEDDKNRLDAIKVNCTIEKQLHPKGDKYTIKKFLKPVVITSENN